MTSRHTFPGLNLADSPYQSCWWFHSAPSAVLLLPVHQFKRSKSGSFTVKGQCNEIFDHQFFSSFEPAMATDQWVKIVWFFISFSLRYSNFFESLPSITLRGDIWLFRILFKGVSQTIFSTPFMNRPKQLCELFPAKLGLNVCFR